MQSGRSLHPLHLYPGPLARTGRRPFRSCRVASPQAPTPDRESLPATIALAPRGTPLYDTTYGNVAPRVGVTYQLRQTANWATVLRGGFGIFYDLGQGSLGGYSSFFPYSATKTIKPSPTPCPSSIEGICFPLSAGDAAPPPLTTNPPVNTILVADPNLTLPRTYQWNVALEQSLGSSQSLSLTYIGAIGRDLLRITNLSDPPNF